MKFHGLTGVVKTRVGYTGGSTPAPTYSSVCANDGHTEALQVTFNREVISYKQIIDVFFSEHNPTARTVRVCSVFVSAACGVFSCPSLVLWRWRCTDRCRASVAAESAVQERDLVS